MKCQNLFSVKNKKSISICHLLKILPRVLSLNRLQYVFTAGDKRNISKCYLLLLNWSKLMVKMEQVFD